jgi:2,3-bisphosphoglycerate-independent phosphoglycerate mutase
MSKKAILLIMDGWGLGIKKEADAIQHAKTPFVSSLYPKYPNGTLVACGTEVGLPVGQMGNSEVGHLNLGAGRIVYQELERINVAVANGEMANNNTLLASINYAKQNNKPLHLMGLVSDGGVHSHIHHIMAICDICKQHNLNKVYIHAFTDGRDTDPKAGRKYLQILQNHLAHSVGKIASITGRYYAMDRDKRWDRVQLAYHAMVHGQGKLITNIDDAMQAQYDDNITDEFIKPLIVCNDNAEPTAVIRNGDAVLCFNFRTDRCREITEVLTQKDFPEYKMQKLDLHYTTITEYDKTFSNVHVMYHNDDLQNTIGEVIAKSSLTQLRIAETEKYPHVSFFFSGGRENKFDGENRIVVPSPQDVATYDLKPEMSAYEIATKAVWEIEKNAPDFICLNFANADMVGHTGVWDAVIKAVETVDACVQKVTEAALAAGYTIFLTADHGNSDYLINDDGSPNTAHTLNLVPLFIINNTFTGEVKNGKLGDVAPTILTFMDLPIPAEMTGHILARP